MDVEPRFRINEPTVIHQTVDDEVVMINLDRGVYYSLAGIGADLWSRLTRRASRREMVAWAHGHFDGDTLDIEQEISRLVELLRAEALIVDDGCADLERTAPDSANEVGLTTGTRRRFEPPRLEKFTDMQDLLLLDPIHDVDAGGWPAGQSEAPPTSELPDDWSRDQHRPGEESRTRASGPGVGGSVKRGLRSCSPGLLRRRDRERRDHRARLRRCWAPRPPALRESRPAAGDHSCPRAPRL